MATVAATTAKSARILTRVFSSAALEFTVYQLITNRFGTTVMAGLSGTKGLRVESILSKCQYLAMILISGFDSGRDGGSGEGACHFGALGSYGCIKTNNCLRNCCIVAGKPALGRLLATFLR